MAFDRSALAAAALALAAWAAGCGKTATRSPTSAEAAESADDDEAADALAPMDAREAAQWEAARQGDAEELMRLEDLVGCEGLRDRAARADLRETALRAMRYCGDFSELPWLVEVAGRGRDDEARDALESIDDLAARPRKATDPEDAAELHAGCRALLQLARDPARPRARRVLAVRALRMLADRGCVRTDEIPTDPR